MTEATATKPTTSQGTRQFCTFTLGDLLLGIEVERVQEVIREQALSHVPKAPDTVKGLMNLRGQIVTAIDLRRRFGLEAGEEGSRAMHVVVFHPDGAVSLLVDSIGDVVELPHDEVAPPPPNISGRARELVRGVVPLESELLLVLDTTAACSIS
ncbi:MAG: chemotaxis protein CheW [Planctomycetota bacterium]|jgi:purine-binding chemotaxis protein CheW